MGSVMFRNRYWYYKSLYDDYMGREFRLAFGMSCVLWLPHYWYPPHYAGTESTSTGPWRRTQPTKTTSSSGIQEGIALHTISASRNSKWCSSNGPNSNASMKKVTHAPMQTEENLVRCLDPDFISKHKYSPPPIVSPAIIHCITHIHLTGSIIPFSSPLTPKILKYP